MLRKPVDERINARIPAEEKAEMEAAAAEEGLSLSLFVRMLFREWKKRQKKAT